MGKIEMRRAKTFGSSIIGFAAACLTCAYLKQTGVGYAYGYVVAFAFAWQVFTYAFLKARIQKNDGNNSVALYLFECADWCVLYSVLFGPFYYLVPAKPFF